MFKLATDSAKQLGQIFVVLLLVMFALGYAGKRCGDVLLPKCAEYIDSAIKTNKINSENIADLTETVAAATRERADIIRAISDTTQAMSDRKIEHDRQELKVDKMIRILEEAQATMLEVPARSKRTIELLETIDKSLQELVAEAKRQPPDGS